MLPRALGGAPISPSTSSSRSFVGVASSSWMLLMCPLKVPAMKHSREGCWLPLLESEPEGDPGSSARRSWKDSAMCSITPTNSLFTGDGIIRCAIRWLTVAAALRRPNGSTVGALRTRCSGERGLLSANRATSLASEKVKWRESSLDGWGPRETLSRHSSLS